MRVVVDTNVLVSAALRDRDPEAVLLYIVGTPGIEWITTPSILDEYRSVLRRAKFGLSQTILEELERLIAGATIVLVSAPVEWRGDPGDAMFVSCAVGAGADFLITGDKGMLEAGKLGSTLVVTVLQFRKLASETGA
jgi:putative PIN family toxin of toxin-antitoxin system